MNDNVIITEMKKRFRGYLPVVVDIETGGLDAKKNPMLEIAAVLVTMGEDGKLSSGKTLSHHVRPFEDCTIDPQSLVINKIKPDHPLRIAQDEKYALKTIFEPIREAMKAQGCHRAVLVGHNAWFDLAFLNAACERTKIKRNPFHPFSSFDTATLGGLAFGQTVLARALDAAGIEFDRNEAHSAIYDAQKTAELFCRIVNDFGAIPPIKSAPPAS